MTIRRGEGLSDEQLEVARQAARVDQANVVNFDQIRMAESLPSRIEVELIQADSPSGREFLD